MDGASRRNSRAAARAAESRRKRMVGLPGIHPMNTRRFRK
ncbi:hypothetical protein C7S15_6937 [Burkholderia cepacia]|nr:hypothetical protein [Burkholderia cepacia]